jgi:hypothetical protein
MQAIATIEQIARPQSALSRPVAAHDLLPQATANGLKVHGAHTNDGKGSYKLSATIVLWLKVNKREGDGFDERRWFQ